MLKSVTTLLIGVFLLFLRVSAIPYWFIRGFGQEEIRN